MAADDQRPGSAQRIPLRRMLAMADDAVTVGHLVRDQRLFTLPVGLTVADAADLMTRRGFGVAPLTEVPIERYVLLEDLAGEGSAPLASRAHRIRADRLIDEASPLSTLLAMLQTQPFVFARHRHHVTGIVTRTDLDQPTILLFVLGLVLSFEAALDHLIDRASEGDWLTQLSPTRRREVEAIHERRRAADAQLELVRCLNLDDRLVLAKKLGLAEDLGFASKSRFRAWVPTVTRIRDGIAHGDTLLGVIGDPVEALDAIAQLRAVAVAAWHRVEAPAQDGEEPAQDGEEPAEGAADG